jgi:phosphoglycerate dehydrogenase-like enzyme
MKIYIILPSGFLTLPESRLTELKKFGEVSVINHSGKLSEIEALRNDPEEKILGVDPDVVEWDLDVKDLEKIPNVKAICVDATAFDWIKPALLREKGIIVVNSPKFSTDSVAEYIVCLTMCVARRLALDMKNNNKIDWTNPPMLLKGKKFGIVGLGTIGKRVGELMQGMGMDVIYWSRESKDDRFTYVELDDLFKMADVIVPTFVVKPETTALITKERIDMMQESALLVLLNKTDLAVTKEYLLEKVAKKEIGGLAFEDDGAKSLASYEGNVWATPAIAWYSQTSLDNLTNIWFDGMVAMASGKPINVAN